MCGVIILCLLNRQSAKIAVSSSLFPQNRARGMRPFSFSGGIRLVGLSLSQAATRQTNQYQHPLRSKHAFWLPFGHDFACNSGVPNDTTL